MYFVREHDEAPQVRFADLAVLSPHAKLEVVARSLRDGGLNLDPNFRESESDFWVEHKFPQKRPPQVPCSSVPLPEEKKAPLGD